MSLVGQWAATSKAKPKAKSLSAPGQLPALAIARPTPLVHVRSLSQSFWFQREGNSRKHENCQHLLSAYGALGAVPAALHTVYHLTLNDPKR